MRWFALACMFFLFTTQYVLAGAWLHDKGNGFISASSILRAMSPVADYEFSLYADYGLTSRLNIGLDVNEAPGAGGHTLLFLRLPISAQENQRKLAVELGLGAHHQRRNWRPMYRLALSWGTGFNNMFGPGWMAVDTTIEVRDGPSEPLFKVDATLGLSSIHDIRPMLQIETAIAKNLPLIWRVTPSLIIPSKGKSVWVIGIQQRSFGSPRTGLKMSLWRRF